MYSSRIHILPFPHIASFLIELQSKIGMDFWWQMMDEFCAQITWASVFQHDMEKQKGGEKGWRCLKNKWPFKVEKKGSLVD